MEKKIGSRSFRDGVVKKPCSPKALPLKSLLPSLGSRGSYLEAATPYTIMPHKIGLDTDCKNCASGCVARKFLYLWMRVTFGRVTPSRARLFHEQKILQKVFGEWREEWWVSQREWKLCVRADCHYRYYLYNLIFQNWKTFVHQQQEMRKRFGLAEHHDTKQKMRQAWKSWLIYVVARRTKLHMKTTALEFRRRSVLCFWWSKWRWRLGRARAEHALHAAAVKHRALSLQLQAWLRWQEQLLFSQQERGKVATAVRHHQRWQKQRCLNAWLKYLGVCRVKRWQNEMAVQFHRATVLQIHFCDWQWAWEWRQSLSAHQALVARLARRMVLRRAFAHWKHWYSCFRALKDNVTRARLQRIRKNLAHQLHDSTLRHRFWRLWQSRVEQREERVQPPSLSAAQSHYRDDGPRQVCQGVVAVCAQEEMPAGYCRPEQMAISSSEHCLLPSTRGTESGDGTSRNGSSTQEQCVFTETLEKQVFAVWRQKLSQHQENRLAERMAILQAEQQLLRRFWFLWHQQAAVCHQKRQWQAMAVAHHHSGLLRRAFCIWRESTQGFRRERMGRAQAAHFQSARLLCWAWSVWRECLALRREEQRKLKRAALHSQRTLLHRALQTWLVYQGRVRSVLQEVAARERQHHRQLLGKVLHRWRENTKARLDGAKKTSQARVHYNRSLCSKVLVQWREVTSVQIYYRQKEAAALREARKALDRVSAAYICFRVSPELVSALAALQPEGGPAETAAGAGGAASPLAAADGRYGPVEGTPSGLCQKEGFCRGKLPTSGHRDSGGPASASGGSRLAVRKQEQWGTARALWFWAFSLQAKVWTAWLGFVLERKRKKARLEWAMQAYQQRLLQEGATRLLRFTAGMKAFRQQLQTQQQVQISPWDSCNAARSSRKQPRRPSFLLEHLGNQRSPEWCTLGEQQLEKPLEKGQSLAPLGGSSLVRPFLPVVLPNVSGPKLPPTAGPGLELLPPSSSMPHGAGGAARGSTKPSISGPQPWGCPSLTRDPDPYLLLPGDSTSTRTGPGYGAEATGHTELEAELEGIQQQLQHYQTTKQNLWSCQRQANSLRRWLELSQEEPRSEDLHLEEQVKTELEEVELQIQQLAKELEAQRRPVGTCIARVRALRRALC
ncbi:Protein SFI1 homolog [Apodemus speciosus]|uniref:Protein SFI1 homolog n=1 Tax=Apodemus speciosus TaxID=105296 RepID=A0ABQ0ER92_APOSI